MLDHPEKTIRLLETLSAALPFEADLTSEVIAALKLEETQAKRRRTVQDISYAGDEGGVVCHTVSEDGGPGIVLSITHLRIPAHLPFAAAVSHYQKHRVKRLKKSLVV